MKIEESIGRFNIRKTLRFEMTPLGKTADFLDGHLEADEERAASLNKVKSAIEAEHLTMVRRVFKSLPDPMPRKFEAIRAAFRHDPEFDALSSRDPRGVMQAILKRCRENGWAIPKELTDHDGWPTLTVKWHWHCFSKYDPLSADALTRKWTGKSKAEVRESCPLLRAPKKRKPSRNYWFDHSPFRVMFGNRTVGMNWMVEDFQQSRTFLLMDGERVIIGITPRESKFSPYRLPDAANTEPSYLLYEEEEGGDPKTRAVPRESVDRPAKVGLVYLFELTGRALRGKTNLNALYLRALLSPANFNDPTFRLRRGCEFFVRKSAEIKKDGRDEHFRQRFNGDRFFVSLRITLNSHIVGVGHRPAVFGDLVKFIAENPKAKFILVGKNGEAASSPLPRSRSNPSLLAGELAKRAVDENACIIFDPKTPKRVLDAVERKFNYIVIRGRDPLEPGGVLRGYQIPNRLFVGDLDAAKKAVEGNLSLLKAKQEEREAEERFHAERRARKAAGRARAEAEYRAAQERRRRMEEIVNGSKPVAMIDPMFSQGRYAFTFRYKTSDNVDHVDTCRANERDEAFQKLRTVRIRPIKVWCDDPAYEADHAQAVQGAKPDAAARLKQLDALKEQGLVTEAEYAEKRAKIISEI